MTLISVKNERSYVLYYIKAILFELDTMKNNEIKDVLMQSLTLDEVHVTGDGTHFQIIVVGELFAAMSRLKQQQMVYAPLMKYITNNHIHALSIKAYTPQTWKQARTLNGS